MSRPWIAIGAVLAILTAAAPRATADDFAGVRERIERHLVKESLPSLVVAVAGGDAIIWEPGFGWAARETRVRATEHTLYALASITKPMTTTGLMVLAERGRLDFDRPANDYLGDAQLQARGGGPPATLRHLANHTAGLATHYQTFYADEPDRPPPLDETIRRYGLLFDPPGERFRYSNLGYGVLGHVIARAAGQAYPDFMREEVFLPLGMTRASVAFGPGPARYP